MKIIIPLALAVALLVAMEILYFPVEKEHQELQIKTAKAEKTAEVISEIQYPALPVEQPVKVSIKPETKAQQVAQPKDPPLKNERHASFRFLINYDEVLDVMKAFLEAGLKDSGKKFSLNTYCKEERFRGSYRVIEITGLKGKYSGYTLVGTSLFFRLYKNITFLPDIWFIFKTPSGKTQSVFILQVWFLQEEESYKTFITKERLKSVYLFCFPSEEWKGIINHGVRWNREDCEADEYGITSLKFNRRLLEVRVKSADGLFISTDATIMYSKLRCQRQKEKLVALTKEIHNDPDLSEKEKKEKLERLNLHFLDDENLKKVLEICRLWPVVFERR